jgi:outer membrane protein OmpA-like peptidoglycan-associated protein
MAMAMACAWHLPAFATHVELGLGLSQPGLNPTEQPWSVGTAWRLGYARPLAKRWQFVATGSYSRYLNDTLSTSSIKFPSGHADSRWRMMALDVGAEYLFQTSTPWMPYARGSAGAAFWNVETLDGEAVPATDASGVTIDFAAQEVILRGALGIRYQASTSVGLALELEGVFLTGLGADFSSATDDSRSRGTASLLVKVSYHFGKTDVYQEPNSMLREPDLESTQVLSHTPVDSDQDGVPDEMDQCPGTEAGAAEWVDVNGCVVDSDGDGVPDFRDDCPESSTQWTVDSTGCVVDTDQDGIPDLLDECPDTPERVMVDGRGCPSYPPLSETRVFRFNYPSGESSLDPEAKAQLRALVPTLKSNPDVKVLIQGYTDNVGAAESNLALSQERAETVTEFFLQEGIPAAQMKAVGKGETNFVASNETAEGRSKNRRIEIVPIP